MSFLLLFSFLVIGSHLFSFIFVSLCLLDRVLLLSFVIFNVIIYFLFISQSLLRSNSFECFFDVFQIFLQVLYFFFCGTGDIIFIGICILSFFLLTSFYCLILLFSIAFIYYNLLGANCQFFCTSLLSCNTLELHSCPKIDFFEFLYYLSFHTLLRNISTLSSDTSGHSLLVTNRLYSFFMILLDVLLIHMYNRSLFLGVVFLQQVSCIFYLSLVYFFFLFILCRYKFLLYKFTNSTMNINSCTNKNRRMLTSIQNAYTINFFYFLFFCNIIYTA